VWLLNSSCCCCHGRIHRCPKLCVCSGFVPVELAVESRRVLVGRLANLNGRPVPCTQGLQLEAGRAIVPSVEDS
jgi:hypothetical protein